MASSEKNSSWAGGGNVSTTTEDDGTKAEVVRAELQGYDSSGLVWRRVAVDGTGQLKTTAAGGGGGAATIADGADTAEGATTDGAVVSDTSGTVSGKIRGLVKWAFERMPASLGQKVMTASLPVVIASDQSALVVASHAVTNAGTFATQAAVTQVTSPWVTNDPGLADTLGQKNMAGSAAVVIASDQTSIPIAVGNFPATQAVTQSGAWTDDVTDRAARLLGHVTVDASTLPAGAAADSSISTTNDHLLSIRNALNDLAFAAIILEAEGGIFQ